VRLRNGNWGLPWLGLLETLRNIETLREAPLVTLPVASL
jgi:hypothetical protein